MTARAGDALSYVYSGPACPDFQAHFDRKSTAAIGHPAGHAGGCVKRKVIGSAHLCMAPMSQPRRAPLAIRLFTWARLGRNGEELQFTVICSIYIVNNSLKR